MQIYVNVVNFGTRKKEVSVFIRVESRKDFTDARSYTYLNSMDLRLFRSLDCRHRGSGPCPEEFSDSILK